MDRYIFTANSVPTANNFNQTQSNAMIALGHLAWATLGNSATVNGLACTQTATPSMSVNVGPGSVTVNQTIDATSFGTLPVDNNQLPKMGTIDTTTNFAMTAPTTAGYSVNYLIQAAFQEQDTAPTVISYYNASNPSVPYAGPGNSGTSQNTVRQQTVLIQALRGTDAPTGTQVTPTATSGYVGLWVVTIAYGQATVTNSNITQVVGAPFAQTRYAPINSPTFTGTVTVPTLSSGNNSNAAASTAWVTSNFNAASGGWAPLASPSFTGTPTAPTPLSTDNSTTIATTAFLGNKLASYAPLFSPALTGTPTAPTPANGNNSTQVATTAFVNSNFVLSSNLAANAVNSSVALRDAAGNLTANNFYGTVSLANNSSQLNGYVSNAAATPSTIALRDGSGNLVATQFNGLATSAEWGDLAERYKASEPLEEGDIVQLGGSEEIEKARMSPTGYYDFWGVVSARPGLRMNEGAGDDTTHPFVAYSGRIPIKVNGKAKKFDYLVLDSDGVAKALAIEPTHMKIIGRALEDKDSEGIGLVQSAVK